MKLGDVVARMDERSRPRRELYEAPLENRRPFLSRSRHRWRNALIAIVALLAVGGSTMLFQADRATVVPVDDVVRRFEARQQTSGRTADEPAAAIAGNGSPTEREQVVVDRQTRAIDSAPSELGPYTLPTEGVFEYKATGGERLSVFGAEHRYPERVYATFTRTGGCGWEGEIDVIEEHKDIVRLCSSPGRVEQTSQTRDLTFFGIREVVTIRCTPPLRAHQVGEEPGAKQRTRCVDDEHTASADLTRTFLGIETIEIGGERVRATHMHVESRMYGRASGTSIDDVWLSVETGMLYRWERKVDTETSAAFGVDARYTEDADFVLTSLEPVR